MLGGALAALRLYWIEKFDMAPTKLDSVFFGAAFSECVAMSTVAARSEASSAEPSAPSTSASGFWSSIFATCCEERWCVSTATGRNCPRRTPFTSTSPAVINVCPHDRIDPYNHRSRSMGERAKRRARCRGRQIIKVRCHTASISSRSCFFLSLLEVLRERQLFLSRRELFESLDGEAHGVESGEVVFLLEASISNLIYICIILVHNGPSRLGWRHRRQQVASARLAVGGRLLRKHTG